MFIHRMLGHYLQSEAGAEGGDAGAAAQESTAADAPQQQDASILTGDAATTEQKPGEGGDPNKAGEQQEGDDKKKDEAEQGAPEKYTDFTLGEGMEMDAEVLGEFQAIAKGLNLTQAQAQGLIDLQASMEGKRAEQLQNAMIQQRQGWADAVKSDPEIGGANYDATVASAVKTIQAFGSPELKSLLNDSGLGNHPALVKFCQKIGAAMSDDKFVLPGTQTSNSNQRAADVLFGDVVNK